MQSVKMHRSDMITIEYSNAINTLQASIVAFLQV